MKLGFFDSGIGGLLVMQSCSERFPEHEYIYVGDTHNLPYGPRTSEEILEFMAPYLLWLLEEQHCDYVVVACNTASAEALDTFMRQHQEYRARIINIIELTRNFLSHYLIPAQKILVLATQRTIASNVYTHISPGNHIQECAMPTLVDLIELDDREGALAVISETMRAYREIDYLILGCTHYIYLRDDISKRYPELEVLAQDTMVIEYLKNTFSLSENTTGVFQTKKTYYVSGNPDTYSKRFSISFQKIVLEH